MLTFDGCDPGANPWVEKYFRDCVMDIRDAVGFTLGLCSIFVWLTAQLPQFVSNIKNQSSEALSIWFLVEWFAGDMLNLLGCLIQGQQLPTTTILAAYFVLMDVIMLLQYIYYGALQARRRRLRVKAARRRHSQRHPSTGHHHHHGRDGRDDPYEQAVPLLQDGGANADSSELSSSAPDSSALPTPAGGSSQALSPPERATGAVGTRSNSSLRPLTAATAAGVSVACVVALALHPVGSPGSPARHLLSLSGPEHRAAGFAAADISSASAKAASSLGPAAAGAAFSAVGRNLAAVLHPVGGSDSSGGDGGGGGGSNGGGCSFLNCDVALVAGTAMGYLSTCFYLASRVSQIRKNLARKSTEGLSPVMFLLTMSANLCTGVSIVLRLRSVEQLKEQLPWMCGTFGTIALDMTLFYQAATLGQAGHHHHDAHDPHGHGHGHHHHGHHHGNGQHGHGHAHGCAASGRGAEAEGLSAKLADEEAPLLGPIAGAGGDGGVANLVTANGGTGVCRS